MKKREALLKKKEKKENMNKKKKKKTGEKNISKQKIRNKIPLHPLLVHAPWPLMQRHQLQSRRQ